MTKGIYLNRANEILIAEYAKQKGVSISKAINMLIETIQPPKEVKQIKQPKKKETPKERPLSRSELFRSISKNRA